MPSSYRAVFFMAVTLAAVAMLVTNSPPPRFLPRWANLTAQNIESNAVAASVTPVGQKPTLEELRKASITAALPPGTLDSYRIDACIFAGAEGLSERTPKRCIKGTLGILLPSSAYLMVAVGKLRIVELVNAEGGWRITAAPASQTQKVTLEAGKANALKEQIAHSLVSLLRLLNAASESELSNIKLSDTSSHVVVTWAEGATSNQFFFNRNGLLCEKQVRTTPQGVTVLKYDQYKNVNGVMLPHRIDMEGSSGKVVAVQVVEAWTLGASWPANFFTPDGVVKGF